MILNGSCIFRSDSRFDNMWLPNIYQELFAIFQDKDKIDLKNWGDSWRGEGYFKGTLNLDLSA